MANSKFEYTRTFERPDSILQNTWIVVRVDGRGFHRLSTRYGFEKPNDKRALDLMNVAAASVLKDLPDLIFAYGQSDEYSFVFDKATTLFERRESKLVTTVVSTFTAHYCFNWATYLPSTPLALPNLPTFDGRAVAYPSLTNLRDYLSWRQADCHINNLFNTTFWSLVNKGGMTTNEAEKELAGTVASDKNEILFSRFGINYNAEPEMYRKGSVIFRDEQNHAGEASTDYSAMQEACDDTGLRPTMSKSQLDKRRKQRTKAIVTTLHVDIIKDEFWEQRPWILAAGIRAK